MYIIIATFNRMKAIFLVIIVVKIDIFASVLQVGA